LIHLDRWNRLDDAASTDGPSRSQCREHLDAPLTVEHLAERAGMSTRHFTRAFYPRLRSAAAIAFPVAAAFWLIARPERYA